MRGKYIVSYIETNGSPSKTFIFGDDKEEAEKIFKENYEGCLLNSIKLADSAEPKPGSPTVSKVKLHHKVEKATKITSEKASMIPFAGMPESLFDWYLEQQNNPEWTHHILFLTREVDDPRAMIITNHFIKAPRLGLSADYIQKLYEEDIAKGLIKDDQTLHVCYTVNKKKGA